MVLKTELDERRTDRAGRSDISTCFHERRPVRVWSDSKINGQETRFCDVTVEEPRTVVLSETVVERGACELVNGARASLKPRR